MAAATPLRSWLDAEVAVAGGSDSPITPFAPLRGMWQAATRTCEALGGPLGPEQRIDGVEALHLYTGAAACAAFAEAREGALRPGALADFCVLSADPTRCDPAELRDARVLLTAVAGEVLHDVR